MSADGRTHDAVAVDNVRRLLAGTLTEPMPGTLAADVRDWGLRAAAHALQQGRSLGRVEGRDQVWAEVQAAAKRAVEEAIIAGIKL